MKLPYMAVVVGILIGIAAVMLVPAQTNEGRALIFLISLLIAAILVELGRRLGRRR